MKQIIRRPLSLLCVLGLVLAAAPAMADDYTMTVDAGKSSVSFISEAPAEKIQGTGKKLSGSIKLSLGDAPTAAGTITLPVESMETGNKLRDRHMRGGDWLNAKKNPNITFTVASLKDAKAAKDGDKTVVTGTAVGKVSVNGVEVDKEAPVTITALPGKGIVKVETKLSVALADHKVEGKKGVVGAKVGKTIEIKGLIYGKLAK